MQERGEEYGLRAANRQDTRGNVLQVVGRKPLARMTSTAWRSSASIWRMMRRRWFLTGELRQIQAGGYLLVGQEFPGLAGHT